MSAKKEDEKVIQMTETEFKAVIKDVIQETLSAAGIEMSDKKELWQDFIFLRMLRQTHEAVKKKALLTLVGTLVIAGLGGIWLLIKSANP